jgi:hypothetical protein
MPHGLGMGGTLEKFRFFIPDTLEDCIASHYCETFETGHLLQSSPSRNTFSIGVMEIWGCGGDEKINNALKEQAKDRGDREVNLQRARQVDKAAFATNSFDQEFLLAKNFSHKVRMTNPCAQDDELMEAKKI